jgi:hypothetical protein
MPNVSDLKPRPLWDDELPTRGDLHFAVGFGPKSALVSRIIAAGTASRTNHVGIITEVTGSEWKIVEALSKGVVEDTHQPPPVSTVIRASDDPAVREALARRAEAGAAADPHIGYDWWTIGRIAFVGLFGRVPFLTFPILAGPPLARYVDPVWVPLVVTVAAIVALYLVRSWLFDIAMACPWPNPRTRMICSEFARRTIEGVFGSDSLPGLADVKPALTSPGDLLQELLHRCDYWGSVPTRQAVVDRRIHH